MHMSGHKVRTRREAWETVQELRRDLGLFSFRDDAALAQRHRGDNLSPDLGVRPGGILEVLVARPGTGAATFALQAVSRSFDSRGIWAIVDSASECYVPALTGWGVDATRILLLRPSTPRELCWAIEQCLRCPAVSATWAWVEARFPARVHRRWQLAAEAGGGVGLFFRPVRARREPVWADSRVLVTPDRGGQGEVRWIHLDVLYRRGGSGGGPQAWEIDHAAGVVRLVPQMADSTTAKRAARA
jgi:hypothetical protein